MITKEQFKVLHGLIDDVVEKEDWRLQPQKVTEDLIMVGPVVPEEFKQFSDGCSVPLPKTFKPLYETHAAIACLIHDYEYFQCRAIWRLRIRAIAYGYPKAEIYRLKILWNATRLQADAHFHSNIRMLWAESGKRLHGVAGRIMATTYTTAVRLNGRRSAKWKGSLWGDGHGRT